MNRSDFQQLSEVRFREARSLLEAGFSDGAYYLAGYSIECALKACIAKRTQAFDFPEKPDIVRKAYTHNLTELMGLSQLAPLLEVAFKTNPVLKDRWGIVRRWSEESRYQKNDRLSAQEIVAAIEDGPEGVLPWIKLHW